MPLYENIAEVEPVLTALRATPGVLAAEPRITVGVVVTASEEIGEDFTLVVGATDTYYREHLDGPGSLVAGHWLSGSEKEVVLGRRVAERLDAGVGAEVLLLGQTQYGSMSPVTAKVVGIVSANALVDNQAYLPLEEARWLLDLPDGALEVLVYTESEREADVAPVLARLAGLPELDGLAVSAWYEREPWASSMTLVSAIKGFIQALIVFIGALAIFNTMTMAVMERSGEIGVMRAMGLTRPGTVGLFVVESLAIGLTGGVAGTAIGAAFGGWLERNGVTLGGVADKIGGTLPMKATVYADVTLGIVTTSILLGLLIAVVGAVLPALRAASIQPVSAMHARR
jgi:ABC-type lipoprotein release transport system permease subunit